MVIEKYSTITRAAASISPTKTINIVPHHSLTWFSPPLIWMIHYITGSKRCTDDLR